MSKELVKQEPCLIKARTYNPTGISLKEIDYLGQVMAQSGRFSSIRDKAQAIVQILAGQEMGIPPLVSMTKINVIQGKISISAELMAMMVKRSSDYNYSVVEHSNTKCSIQFLYRGQAGYLSTFTIEDARLAGLIKSGSGWEKYPRAMLFSRALSQGARIECPHLLNGAYTAEEMGAVVNEEGEIISVQTEEINVIDESKLTESKEFKSNQKQQNGDVTPAQHNAMRNMLAKISDSAIVAEWTKKVAEVKTAAEAGKMIVALGQVNIKKKPIVEVKEEFKDLSIFNQSWLKSIGKEEAFLSLLGAYGCVRVEEIAVKDQKAFLEEVEKMCDTVQEVA